MSKTGARGFTLLELLVVMLIITIIAGFASLSANLIRRERVAGVAREIYADLQKARMDAMTKDSKGFGIRLESANSYVLFKFNDCNDDYHYDPKGCEGAPEETETVRKTLHSSISILKKNMSSFQDEVHIFDRFGRPRNDDWGMGNVSIVVKSSPDAGLAKCVVISDNRIREAIWNGSKCVVY